METLLSSAAGWIAAIVAVLFAFFKYKSAAVEKQKAEDKQAATEQVVVETKAAATKQVNAVKVASDAKTESNDLSDDNLRSRMRTQYTKE